MFSRLNYFTEINGYSEILWFLKKDFDSIRNNRDRIGGYNYAPVFLLSASFNKIHFNV